MGTVADMDVLVCWNFRPVVRLEKIRLFNAVNLEHGDQPIQIYSPREVTTMPPPFTLAQGTASAGLAASPSAASAASAWGSQRVIAMARYRSMAVESSARASSSRPIFA
jgi:hypothetical protein